MKFRIRNSKLKIDWRLGSGDWKFKRGFTVVELMVSIGILGILYALTSINLGRLPSVTSQDTTIDTLLTDIRSQQTQAMASNTSFGIHIGSTSYTLLPSNFVINLDPGISFTSVSFTGGDLNFVAGSGENTPGSFTVSNDQTGDTKVININKYGATY